MSPTATATPAAPRASVNAAHQRQIDDKLEKIRALGFEVEYEPMYPVGDLSPEHRVQVRSGQTAQAFAPKKEAQSYALQMKGSAFPPFVTTADAWLVDGNTEVAAYGINDQPFAPALVLKVSYVGSSDEMKAKLRVLGTDLNADNGKRMSPAELRRSVRDGLTTGDSFETISQGWGVPMSQIGQVKKEMDAEQRLTSIGYNIEPLSLGQLRTLGTTAILALNDEPLVKLAELAVDADLSVKEIKTLAAEAKATGSDNGALTHLNGYRTENAERIRVVRRGGKAPNPSHSSQARQHLGVILKHEGDPTALVERDPDAVERHKDYLTRSVALIEAVLAAQEDAA